MVRQTLALALAVAAAGCGASRAGDSRGADEILAPGVALASFDSLWSIVGRTYVDTAFVSGKWAGVRESLRPRAMTIERRSALDRLFAEALDDIPDSHFYIIPARVAPADPASARNDGRGSTGLQVRLVGEEVVTWRVSPGSPASKAGLNPGEIVKRIGGVEPGREVERIEGMPEEARPRALSELLIRLNAGLAVPAGDTVIVELERDGGPAVHRLVAVPAEGRLSKFGNLPPIAGLVSWSRVPVSGGCVGTIAFNIWLPALVPDLERAVDSVASCRGIVVDLRGNPGGVGAMVMGFGGYFVDSVQSLGTMKMRDLSLNFVINPQRSRNDGSQMSPFSGPVAVLVDPMSASTSEIFASGMQRIGRVRVFGQKSAGAALPALMNRLPSGDVFVHAIADFTDPEGRRIEGAGTEPDVEVPLTIEGLRTGRDMPLEAAVEWIVKEGERRG